LGVEEIGGGAWRNSLDWFNWKIDRILVLESLWKN